MESNDTLEKLNISGILQLLVYIHLSIIPLLADFYHPHMRVGNGFSHVCLSVCSGYTFHFCYAGMSLPYVGQV